MVMIRILLSTRLGERRWTQAKLAEKTGIRKATVNEIYNELTDKVRLSDLDKICCVLECDLGDLLVRDGNNPFDENTSKA
jgi:putative transcriptional regulator